jgi:hypothetical protein
MALEISISEKTQSLFWKSDSVCTRNILRQKNMTLPLYNCVHCASQSEETLEHLFLDCPFAHLVVQRGDPFHTLASFRNQLAVSFSMNIIITMSWCIWMEQNDLIFKGIQPSLGNLCFKKEFALVILRAKTTCERLRCTVSISKKKPLVSLWINSACNFDSPLFFILLCFLRVFSHLLFL